MVKGNAHLRLFLFFAAGLRFGHVSYNSCVLGNDDLATVGLEIHRDYGHDFVTRLGLLGINGFRQLHRDHASWSDSRSSCRRGLTCVRRRRGWRLRGGRSCLRLRLTLGLCRRRLRLGGARIG